MAMSMVVMVVVVTTVCFLGCLWSVRVQALDELRRAGLVMGKEILRPVLEVNIKWETLDNDVVGHDRVESEKMAVW